MPFQIIRHRIGTVCIALVGVASMSAASAETRLWLDDQGREVRATFNGMAEGDQLVMLKLENGSVVSFPIARLSQACQAYAKEAASAKPESNPEYNFESAWPEIIGFREDPEIEIILEDAKENVFIYESMNFRYICDVRMSRALVRGFALLFEATYLYCKAMPLGMGEGARTDGKFLIKLYETREAYVKAGAPPDSAGVFMGGRNLIKVPFESLGVRKQGSGYTHDRSASNRVLAHEIAHQLTPPAYFARGQFNSWFIEGIAEYVAATPYRAGQFNTRLGRRAIVDYATAFSKDDNRGRNIGTNIKLSSLEYYMDLPYRDFVGTNGNFNYAVALLITYYFIHLDGEGDGANLKAYKRALLDGKGKEEANQVLLNGRTFDELQSELEAKWRRHGVRFTFDS